MSLPTDRARDLFLSAPVPSVRCRTPGRPCATATPPRPYPTHTTRGPASSEGPASAQLPRDGDAGDDVEVTTFDGHTPGGVGGRSHRHHPGTADGCRPGLHHPEDGAELGPGEGGILLRLVAGVGEGAVTGPAQSLAAVGPAAAPARAAATSAASCPTRRSRRTTSGETEARPEPLTVTVRLPMAVLSSWPARRGRALVATYLDFVVMTTLLKRTASRSRVIDSLAVASVVVQLLVLYWPVVTVEGPVSWTDKVVHVLVFAVPTFLVGRALGSVRTAVL